MDEFVRQRITQLRLQKNVSEVQMSYDLGHSKSYINNITVRKSLPSLGEFFAICDYFSITPIQFFDETLENPVLTDQAIQNLKKLDAKDTELVLLFIERLLEK